MAAASLSIRKVDSKADFETFLRFPWSVYKSDPYWVPPLVSMQRHKLDQHKNSSWKHMEGDYFIAWRGDQPVGTIAAFINHRHDEFWNERMGFFGAFELFNDQEAADALLSTAAEWVRAKGATALRGPVTFSTNEECGVLIEGFDDIPVVLYPYNPRYYVDLLDNAPDLHGVMDTVAFYFTLHATEQSEKVQKMLRITEKNNARRGITVREPDRKHLKEDFSTLKDVYNSAWEKNWGFVPFSDDELDELVKDLGMFVDRRVMIFAQVHGEPAGFLLALPDMNLALRRAYPRPGKPDLLTQLQVLWHWKLRSKITRIRIPLMGVKEQFRGIGVEAAMFTALYHRATEIAPQMGWVSADGGWVLETNDAMNRLSESHNGYVYKRFRFYQRDLTP